MTYESFDSSSTFLTPPGLFHLKYTLKCGQIFRWTNLGPGYFGFLHNSPLYLKQYQTKLGVTGNPETIAKISTFFRWDDPLETIIKNWQDDPILREAAAVFPGLRLIRQDPWSSLLGFLLSMVSNIPKIESSLDKIARHSGKRIPFLKTHVHLLPSHERLSTLKESTLRGFGIGFRAHYVKACAKQMAQGFPLKSLSQQSYPNAKKALMELPGIGEKIADCVLLFGLGHLEAFPVDVWMKRIVEHYYFKGKKKTEKYLSDWGRDQFGPWAGYAQQYLYTYGRWKLDRQSPFRHDQDPINRAKRSRSESLT